jgi:hypothetical protein
VRRRVPAIATLGVAALLTGGAAVLGASASPAQTPVEPAGGAAAFAAHVLAEATVPPGGQPTATVRTLARRWLLGPSATPGMSGIVDRHELFSYDEPATAVESYIRTHLRPGETVSATGSATGSALSTTVVVPVSGRHEYTALLEYTAAPTTTGLGRSELRIDALSVWMPSRPASEQVSSRGATVTVRGYRSVSPGRGSLGAVTVTLSAPGAARVVDAFDALARGPQVMCMEGSPLYTLSIRTATGRTYTVTGSSCARSVSVAAGGSHLPELTDKSCALLGAVASVVAHAATATRRAVSSCTRNRPG